MAHQVATETTSGAARNTTMVPGGTLTSRGRTSLWSFLLDLAATAAPMAIALTPTTTFMSLSHR